MLTNVANRIADRADQLAPAELLTLFRVALEALDAEAAEEIANGGHYDGPAVSGLNALADNLGVDHVQPDEDFADDIDDEVDATQ